MSETDKDLQKAVDEHLKRLYERYKSNAKVFTATHIGHISLSIVFVLSILFPFLYLQIDARETNSELERLSQSIAQQDQQAAAASKAGVEQLNQKKEQIQKGKEGLNNALKNIKTRFGKLGLEVVAITDREIVLAMPLWIDPLAPLIQRKIKFAVLLIPAVASVLALLIVFYCWTIPDAFPGLTGMDYVKYILYYLLNAGLFFFGFQRIRGAIKNYGVSSSATEL